MKRMGTYLKIVELDGKKYVVEMPKRWSLNQILESEKIENYDLHS
jgi:hypothetical protein